MSESLYPSTQAFNKVIHSIYEVANEENSNSSFYTNSSATRFGLGNKWSRRHLALCNGGYYRRTNFLVLFG